LFPTDEPLRKSWLREEISPATCSPANAQKATITQAKAGSFLQRHQLALVCGALQDQETFQDCLHNSKDYKLDS